MDQNGPLTGLVPRSSKIESNVDEQIAAETTLVAPPHLARLRDVGRGSKSEELILSKCLPGYPSKRTSLDTVGMSQTCQ
ncbi:hypothetical protein SAMN05444159_1196 [Bradyrhizobium lablabi]|uniref:Uncharacterized protein n=1 Tax=Bradyrhizobium lablabi TaxID=722472 RepID=A0A1M6L7I9_9BRAD|nr:hypothetical protein SAMN05444159_1196 [Bradyrhizobium lablabi]